MNFLILAAGTRNKIVQYFKENFRGCGMIIATDASPLGPAIYEADKFYIVPPISAPGYIQEILSICEKENICGVLSLIDPELSLLAAHEKEFNDIGVTVVGSSYELCELAFNKYHMDQWLHEHGYRSARSWISKEEFYQDVESGSARYPVYVKPVCGSASINITKVCDRETVDLLFRHYDDLMIQEFLDGQEIGVDVYVDMISGEVVSIFTKKKLRMRAGETDKSVSFKEPGLFEFVEEFVRTAGFRGQIDIDIIEIGGEYYILEVNPRFGGGYPHAYEAGCNHIKLILENLQGNANEKQIGDYDDDVYMMKYNEVCIQRGLKA